MSETIEKTKAKMGASLEAFDREIAHIRTGKANPAILDRVKVDLYGSTSPLSHVATINTPDVRTIVITPWDKASLGEIERAIHQSDIGVSPTNDGNTIRINIPALTEERRKDLVKQVKKVAEEAKVGLRNHRREANDLIKAQEKKKELSEDESRRLQDQIQKLTDDFTKKIVDRAAHKEAELMH